MNAYPMQLNLFEDNSPDALIRREVSDLRESGEKLRRSLFARHGDLLKIYMIQQEEINLLRSIVLKDHPEKAQEFAVLQPVAKPKKEKSKDSKITQLTFKGMEE